MFYCPVFYFHLWTTGIGRQERLISHCRASFPGHSEGRLRFFKCCPLLTGLSCWRRTDDVVCEKPGDPLVIPKMQVNHPVGQVLTFPLFGQIQQWCRRERKDIVARAVAFFADLGRSCCFQFVAKVRVARATQTSQFATCYLVLAHWFRPGSRQISSLKLNCVCLCLLVFFLLSVMDTYMIVCALVMIGQSLRVG